MAKSVIHVPKKSASSQAVKRGSFSVALQVYPPTEGSGR